MRRPLNRALLPLLLTASLGATTACGKRADPQAPYLKTPQPPTALAVSQVGDGVEIQVTAPLTTTQNRPLPVIELEWLQGPATGDFLKLAKPLFREEVAPGETRTKSFPIPAAAARFSALAYSGRTPSNPAPVLPFTPAPIPAPPTGVQAVNLPTGVQLTWTNPPGAEPWPTPPPAPTASPLASPTPMPGDSSALPAAAAPQEPASSVPVPRPSTPAVPSAVPALAMPGPDPPTPQALPGGTPSTPDQANALPAGSPLPEPGADPGKPGSTLAPAPPPSPTPTPALLAGIRIFRTDGVPRPARQPLQASSWLDEAPRAGENPCYSLRYAASIAPLVESASTEPVCVEVKDLVPPEPPDRLLGDIGDSFVELSWLPSRSADVHHYLVYRTMQGEARAMVIQTEGLLLRVRDLRMTPGPRTYEVTAVDEAGNESPPGPPLQITIP